VQKSSLPFLLHLPALKDFFSEPGSVISRARTLRNTERAQLLIFIQDNDWAVESSITKSKLRSDRERGKEMPKLPLRQEEELDDLLPSTSSQSLWRAPKSSWPTNSLLLVHRVEESGSD
jgi:hypothetical protein